MAKVKIIVELKNGDDYQIIIKIGDQTFRFKESGSKTIDLDPKKYIALIGGFQDPDDLDSTVHVEFRQKNKLLNETTITQRSFIKPLLVEVE